MALKFVVDNLDDIEEAHRPLYVERDGKFALAVEGAVSNERLAEFRDNNRSLKKQLDDLSKQFEGVDVDKFLDIESDGE